MAVRKPGESYADTLGPYLEAIRRHPPLTREEERQLAERARAGDLEARQQLARHNLAFVVAVVRRSRHFGVRFDDLVQEGNVGLMRAIEKFDPDAGTRFSTYAVFWIRAHVGRYLKEARSAVRPRAGAVAQPDLSLDATMDDRGETTTRLERMEDDAPGPEDRYLAREDDERVRVAISKVRKSIGGLGWDIVHARLEQDEPTPLEEIGRRWGLSRERVRQAEIRARRVLRHALAGGIARRRSRPTRDQRLSACRQEEGVRETRAGGADGAGCRVSGSGRAPAGVDRGSDRRTTPDLRAPRGG